jgi:hypothetical protein
LKDPPVSQKACRVVQREEHTHAKHANSTAGRQHSRRSSAGVDDDIGGDEQYDDLRRTPHPQPELAAVRKEWFDPPAIRLSQQQGSHGLHAA